MVIEPVIDAVIDAAVLEDFGEARHAHDGVVAGAFDDGGTGALHFGPAPGEDGESRVACAKFGNDGGGMIVAAGFKGGEEQRRCGGGSGGDGRSRDRGHERRVSGRGTSRVAGGRYTER